MREVWREGDLAALAFRFGGRPKLVVITKPPTGWMPAHEIYVRTLDTDEELRVNPYQLTRPTAQELLEGVFE